MSTIGFRCAMDRMGSPEGNNVKQVSCSQLKDKRNNLLLIFDNIC